MTTRIRRRLAADDGVSLVEMLVSIFIIGLVFAALASTMTTSMASIRGNESRTRATALANEVLENMGAVSWSQLGFYDDDVSLAPDYVSLGAARPASSPAPLPWERSPATLRDGTQYEVRRTVVWYDDPATGSPQDYKQLRVEVSWAEGTAARSIAVEALRAPDPNEQAASEFTLSLVDAEPAIVYLDASGQVQAPPSGTYAAMPVTLTARTNRPPDSFVYVTYLGSPLLALSGSNANRTWTRIEAGQTWPNGDVQFEFSATRGAESVTANKLVRFVRPLVVEDFTTTPAGLCFDSSDDSRSYPEILVALRIQGTVAEDEVVVAWATSSGQATFAGSDASTGASNWTFTIPADSYDDTMESVSVQVTRVLDMTTLGPVVKPFPITVAPEGYTCA